MAEANCKLRAKSSAGAGNKMNGGEGDGFKGDSIPDIYSHIYNKKN